MNCYKNGKIENTKRHLIRFLFDRKISGGKECQVDGMLVMDENIYIYIYLCVCVCVCVCV